MTEHPSDETTARIYELRAIAERQSEGASEQIYCRASLNGGFGTPVALGIDFHTNSAFADTAQKLLSSMVRKLS